MLGFDSHYQNDIDDAKLAEISGREQRILLSRDRRLLMRKSITAGYCLRSLNSLEQLNEVVQRFDLAPRVIPFHRCLRCNHELEPVRKEEVLDRLEPLTKQYFNEFHICRACGQIYWKGSHYEKLQRVVEKITNSPH
jgi:uncharacterized protein with PIN domain